MQYDTGEIMSVQQCLLSTNLKLMKKVLENQDKARDKWFAAKETAGASAQHKGDGSKRE